MSLSACTVLIFYLLGCMELCEIGCRNWGGPVISSWSACGNKSGLTLLLFLCIHSLYTLLCISAMFCS